MPIKKKTGVVADESASSDDSNSDTDNPSGWSYRRWAWEFLIRNKEFITACKDVSSGSSDQRKEVASRFGLKKFKAFDEPYEKDKKKGICKPKFEHYAIRSWSTMNGHEHPENVPFKITLSKNQVMVLFDLNSISVRKDGLNRQLKLTEELLQDQLKNIQCLQVGPQQGSVASDSLITDIPNGKNYLRHLRILDVYDLDKPTHEYAKIVYPRRTEEQSKAKARESINKMVDSALKNAESGYRAIAAWGGKPKGKKKVIKD